MSGVFTVGLRFANGKTSTWKVMAPTYLKAGELIAKNIIDTTPRLCPLTVLIGIPGGKA